MLRLYQQASVMARFGAWQCELPGNRLGWTDGVYDLFGMQRGSVVHRPSTVDLYEPDSRRAMERARADCIAGGTRFAIDCRIRTVGGERRWMRLSARVSYEHGRAVRLYGTKQDVTHEKALWGDLQRQLEIDPLTGLGNRLALERALAGLEWHRAADTHLAFALVGIDGLADLTMRLGRRAAEAAIREAGERLRRTLAGVTLIARTGDGEFAVLLASRLGRRAVLRTLAIAHRAVQQPDADAAGTRLAASVGVALLEPGQPADPQDLFAQADAALCLAKAQGEGAFQVFGGALDALAATASAGPLRDTG